MKDYKLSFESKQHVLQICLKLFGEDHPDTARGYRAVGVAQHSKHTMKDYKSALESYKKALQIRLKLYGEYHPDTAKSYEDIGLVQDCMKNYK